MPTAYENLKDRYHLLSNLSGADSILYMDSMVAMKSGSQADRSEQSMALATAAQKLLTLPEVGDWLKEAEETTGKMSYADQVNLRLMQRQWLSMTTLPESLVRERARLGVEANNLHTKYRDTGDWKVMKPVYESAFRIAREIGEILKDALGFTSPYEALLDQFNPGLKLDTVNREFARLEAALPGMITEAQDLQEKAGPARPLPEVPVSTLEKLGQQLVLNMGFDDTRGIMYVGDMHPMCGGTPDDSRLTTRYDPKDPIVGLYTIAHEAGHSLYYQGTPKEWRYQPVGLAMGMDLHESQSMIMELQATRTPEFHSWLSSQLMTHHNDPAFTPENIARNQFHVEPSFIRIYADELTYPLHIILRFNIERDMIAGRITIDDLPDAWNDGMKNLLGIVPPGPAKGHMQDVHWPTLSIGYFPAYTLGAMGAAQFFNAALSAHPEIRSELSQGQFKTLRTWLEKNVHSKGSLLTQDQLFTAATGEPLNAVHFMNSLSRRYLGRNYAA